MGSDVTLDPGTRGGAAARLPAGLLLLALAAVAVALVPRLTLVETSDVAWILYGAGRLLDGARLGVDVVENTPPMIFWLTSPVLAVGRAVGADAWHAWLWGMVALAAAASVGTIGVLSALPAWRGRDARLVTLAALLVATLVLPGFDFGQREHLTLLLTLPYVALAGVRLHGARVATAAAVGVGLAAGLGIGIKPHFALLPLALAAADAAHQGPRATLRRPEHWAVVIVGVLYLIAVAVATPEWLAFAREFGPRYATLSRHALRDIALRGDGALEAIAPLLAWGALRRCTAAPRGPMLAVALATATFYAVAVLQLKGWRYHFLPAVAYGFLLAALVLAGLWHGTTRRRALAGLATAVLLIALPGWALRFDADVGRGVRPRPDVDRNLPGILAALEGRPPATVAVLSSNIASSFPLVRSLGARSVLRHPLLWPLRLDDVTVEEPDGIRRCPERAARTAIARRFLDELATDLTVGAPEVVILMTPDAGDWRWDGARWIDYRQCLDADPRTAGFLDGYRQRAQVGPYLVLDRR